VIITKNQFLNLAILEEKCAESSEFLQLMRRLFPKDSELIQDSIIAEEAIFMMSERMHGLDIDKFAGSNELGNMSRFHVENLFWELDN
jgi:hypothetical protein